MKLQVGGALLLVSIGLFAAGCGTGVYGSAVTPAGPAAAPSSSLVPSVLHVPWTRASQGPDVRVVTIRHPVKGATYRFAVWVRGSSNLMGGLPKLRIGILGIKGAVQKYPVSHTWHRYSIVRVARSTDALQGHVYAPYWAPKHGWFDIAGAALLKVSGGSK